MLTLVLGEAELELMPPELMHHPSVITHARQRGKNPEDILLDSNYHHAAMQALPEGRRRGRPDMVHLFLLTALESVANKKGLITLIVHTRNNEMITVQPHTRIMRNYERFLGLMEQLLSDSDRKHGLLTLKRDMPLERVITDLHADTILVFSKTGKSVVLDDYFRQHSGKHIVCVLGGFPSGDFHANITSIASERVSVYPEMLSVWTVTSEILVNYENVSR